MKIINVLITIIVIEYILKSWIKIFFTKIIDNNLKKCKFYNNFYKFNNLKKEENCKYNMGFINLVPISNEPMKAVELFKTLYSKSNKMKLYFLGKHMKNFIQ